MGSKVDTFFEHIWTVITVLFPVVVIICLLFDEEELAGLVTCTGFICGSGIWFVPMVKKLLNDFRFIDLFWTVILFTGYILPFVYVLIKLSK